MRAAASCLNQDLQDTVWWDGGPSG